MRKALMVFAGLLCLSLVAAAPAETQEAPQHTLYTYVSLWGVPRAHWGQMAKFLESTQPVFDKLVDEGTLTGYGTCAYEVHQVHGFTHCSWFQATSVGNILRALNAVGATAAAAPVLDGSRHADEFFQSTMYGGRPGTFHNGYLWFGHFTIKPGHVGDWSGLFEKFVRPALDKMVKDGDVVGYELFTPLVHTPGSSNTVNYSFVTSSPDGIDKFFAAVGRIEAQNPAIPAAIDSFELPAGHYDLIASVPVMREK